MFTLKANAMQRIVLMVVIDLFGKNPHTVSELNQLMKLSDKLNFTPEERAELKMRNVRNEHTGSDELVWDPRKEPTVAGELGELVDTERDIELSDEQRTLLYTAVKAVDEKKELGKNAVAPLKAVGPQFGFVIPE